MILTGVEVCVMGVGTRSEEKGGGRYRRREKQDKKGGGPFRRGPCPLPVPCHDLPRLSSTPSSPVHVSSFCASVVVPVGQVRHVRSVLVVGSSETYSPASHVSSAMHDAWFALG